MTDTGRGCTSVHHPAHGTKRERMQNRLEKFSENEESINQIEKAKGGNEIIMNLKFRELGKSV